MLSNIHFEDRFGIERNAGLLVSSTEVDGELYELLAVNIEIANTSQELAKLEYALNVDCREGYAIYPILDSYGGFVWYDRSNLLVLCLARGIWG